MESRIGNSKVDFLTCPMNQEANLALQFLMVHSKRSLPGYNITAAVVAADAPISFNNYGCGVRKH